jgi:hypothetical protein
MDIPASLRDLLLSNHQPLGLVLGTPRAQLKRPDWFRPSSVERWSFAQGTLDGVEVAWTLDPSAGLLSEARVIIQRKSGTAALVQSIHALFEAEFGKPRLLKRNEERAWTINAELKSTLSVSVRSSPNFAGVIVVNLALAKGQRVEAVEAPRQTSMKVPPSLETLLAKHFDVTLGTKTDDESSAELKFSDARAGFPKTARTMRDVEGGKLYALRLELPDFKDEGETHADAHAALLASLTARLGKAKTAKKHTDSMTKLQTTWMLAEGQALELWSLDSCTATQETPSRLIGVAYQTVD